MSKVSLSMYRTSTGNKNAKRTIALGFGRVSAASPRALFNLRGPWSTLHECHAPPRIGPNAGMKTTTGDSTVSFKDRTPLTHWKKRVALTTEETPLAARCRKALHLTRHRRTDREASPPVHDRRARPAPNAFLLALCRARGGAPASIQKSKDARRISNTR